MKDSETIPASPGPYYAFRWAEEHKCFFNTVDEAIEYVMGCPAQSGNIYIAGLLVVYVSDGHSNFHRSFNPETRQFALEG